MSMPEATIPKPLLNGGHKTACGIGFNVRIAVRFLHYGTIHLGGKGTSKKANKYTLCIMALRRENIRRKGRVLWQI